VSPTSLTVVDDDVDEFCAQLTWSTCHGEIFGVWDNVPEGDTQISLSLCDTWKEASIPYISSIRPVVSIHYRLVTDRQTYGRTQDDSKYRASIVSRGKNRQSIHDTSLVYIKRCFYDTCPLLFCHITHCRQRRHSLRQFPATPRCRWSYCNMPKQCLPPFEQTDEDGLYLWWPTSANLRPKTRHTTPTPQPHPLLFSLWHHSTFQNVVWCG